MTPGDVVADRFVIRELAGSGGMGTCTAPTIARSAETIALKLLQRLHSTNTRASCVRRASSSSYRIRASSDTSRTVVRLRRAYLVMEWLPGTNLSVRLREGR